MQIVVDVFEMARVGQSVAGSAPIKAMGRLLPMLVNPDGDVAYRFRSFTDRRQRPAASLSLNTKLALACNHCDRPMPFALEACHDYYFVHDEASLDAVAVDAGGDEPLLGARCFDLAALIEDEIILGVPLAPRHPACQAEIDVASGARTQAGDEAKGPFAALAAWRGTAGREATTNKR